MFPHWVGVYIIKLYKAQSTHKFLNGDDLFGFGNRLRGLYLNNNVPKRRLK